MTEKIPSIYSLLSGWDRSESEVKIYTPPTTDLENLFLVVSNKNFDLIFKNHSLFCVKI